MRAVWPRGWLVLYLLLALLAYAPTRAAADVASPWTAGPQAVGDDTFSAFIDAPAAGAILNPAAMVDVRGWVVDTTAIGWSGIDDVQVWIGLMDQGGTLVNRGAVGIRRDDVASALGNPYWATSGFNVSFAPSGLGVGSNALNVYVHTPNRGWWYRQVLVTIPAAPARAYADDPLLVVREAVPSLDVGKSTTGITLRGYAIDRNLPLDQQLGVGGSGVSQVQVYLDGPRHGGDGVLLGNATLGLKNREATGFGERFLMSGWEITIHPSDFSVDRHELFIYADSAYWPNESLVIVLFNVH